MNVKQLVPGIGILSMAACGFAGEAMFDNKACRAEAPSNVKAIKEAQAIYNSENDAYLMVAPHPMGTPSRAQQSWGAGNSGFNNLNWHPDGNVRGVYSVTTTGPSSINPGGDFEVKGVIDCDEDGVMATFTATKSLNVKMTTSNNVF